MLTTGTSKARSSASPAKESGSSACWKSPARLLLNGTAASASATANDKSFAVGLSAGIVVCVCTNMAFGGTTVIKRRHTSGIVLAELIDRAVASLEDDFLKTEAVCEDLKDAYLRDDDEARSCIVRAAELGVINSSDILLCFREFKSPSHEEFAEPTRWSLMNALTETLSTTYPSPVFGTILSVTGRRIESLS